MLTHVEEVTDLRGETWSALGLTTGLEFSVARSLRCRLRDHDRRCESNNNAKPKKRAGAMAAMAEFRDAMRVSRTASQGRSTPVLTGPHCFRPFVRLTKSALRVRDGREILIL